MAAKLSEAIERLQAVCPTDAAAETAYEKWLEIFVPASEADLAKREKRKPLTAARLIERRKAARSEFRQSFDDRGYHVGVFPDDILAACDAVTSRTAVVDALAMGSADGNRYDSDGSPKRVFILVRDLKNLLSAQPKGVNPGQ